MSNRRSEISVWTRRNILKAGAAGALGITGFGAGTVGLTGGGRVLAAPAGGARSARPKPRPDLLHADSPKGLEIIQLTTDAEVGSSHIYMESQIFTPDSKRFILQRSGHAHGSDRNDPHHRFMLCDIDDHFALHPLTDELGTTGPAVSPDGKYLYYFVDEGKGKKRRALLKRVNLDGRDRQTLMVIDGPLPGTRHRPTQLYPLSTISSDGKRLALSARLEGSDETPVPYGLMVFDVEKAEVNLVIHGPTWINMHPQYSRSTDPERKHDILIQENHGNQRDERGRVIRTVSGLGADIHVIRDDGTNFRDMPWGRDGNEFCQGHQCWRGRSDWAITSTLLSNPKECQLIEGRPAPAAGHIGLKTPGGVRNHLSRDVPQRKFYHFATDIAGKKLISDFDPFNPAGLVVMGKLGTPGRDPLTDYTILASPKPSGKKEAHMHPFFSPDGKMAFFNSDESGLLQAYAILGVG